MISVNNISKSFGIVRAVTSMTFQINHGEIVGLLGPNGAGKSTTMRMMTGYLSPDSGDIIINGTSVTDNPLAAQQHIGYLPENNPLYSDMVVSELLNYSAELKGIDKEQRRDAMDFAVRSVSIENVYYRSVRELSKGYKQRVGLAIALLHKPKILILDEPSEGLDPNQRTDIRALITSLAKHHTIIMSTHVMQEVEAVCHRMLIINNGQLVADGSPKALMRKNQSGNRMVIELEGKEIEKSLQKLTGLESLELKKGREGRMIAYIGVKNKVKLQPELSKMAAAKKWIIWKLTEEEVHLEDVFLKLTESTL